MEPLPKHLESISTFPTTKNISDVRLWFGLVNQVAHYSQLRDMVAPLKPLLSSKSQFYWTNDLDESFNNSKQAIVNAIKHSVEIFNQQDQLNCTLITLSKGWVSTLRRNTVHAQSWTQVVVIVGGESHYLAHNF